MTNNSVKTYIRKLQKMYEHGHLQDQNLFTNVKEKVKANMNRIPKMNSEQQL